MSEFPVARTSRLLVEELDGELMVYDQDADTAHVLTDDVARVWQMCDGKVAPHAIAGDLQMDLSAVTTALEELQACGLLAAPVTATPEYSRRAAMRKAAKVGAVTASAPLIYSLAIAPAAANASPLGCALVICVGIDSAPGQAKQKADNVCGGATACQTTSKCNGTSVTTLGITTVSGLCQF